MRRIDEIERQPGFDDVSYEERIAFVQEPWDRIAAESSNVRVPPEHRRILDERLEQYRADPQRGRAWSEVRYELMTKLEKT